MDSAPRFRGLAADGENGLVVGTKQEVVTVESVTAQINTETHNVSLSGPNTLQFATLEAGVTTTPASVGCVHSLFQRSVPPAEPCDRGRRKHGEQRRRRYGDELL